MAPSPHADFLPRSFFDRPTRTVARELLGCRLVRKLDGILLAGAIVETEAYVGERDLACHAKAGRTRRNEVMYGPPGFAYVYFTYGMHWMLNLVTEAEGFPAAVLIRAFEPLEGIARMQELRGGKPLSQLASGPAKLTRALGIGRGENGLDCCRPDSPLTLVRGPAAPPSSVAATPRIGLGQTPEPWLSKPWRFVIRGNGFVSR